MFTTIEKCQQLKTIPVPEQYSELERAIAEKLNTIEGVAHAEIEDKRFVGAVCTEAAFPKLLAILKDLDSYSDSPVTLHKTLEFSEPFGAPALVFDLSYDEDAPLELSVFEKVLDDRVEYKDEDIYVDRGFFKRYKEEMVLRFKQRIHNRLSLNEEKCDVLLAMSEYDDIFAFTITLKLDYPHIDRADAVIHVDIQSGGIKPFVDLVSAIDQELSEDCSTGASFHIGTNGLGAFIEITLPHDADADPVGEERMRDCLQTVLRVVNKDLARIRAQKESTKQ